MSTLKIFMPGDTSPAIVVSCVKDYNCCDDTIIVVDDNDRKIVISAEYAFVSEE